MPPTSAGVERLILQGHGAEESWHTLGAARADFVLMDGAPIQPMAGAPHCPEHRASSPSGQGWLVLALLSLPGAPGHG